MAALRTFYQRIIDSAASHSRSSGRPLAGPGGGRRNAFLRRLLGASTATFGFICAGAPVAYATNFTCSWNDDTADWTSVADWSNCNSTFPNNGSGNTFDATIATGDPTLTTAVTIGNATVNSPGAWTITGTGASATLTGTLTSSGGVALQNGSSVTASGLSNSGTLAVDTVGPGGSSLNITGTLTNSASLGIGTVISQATTVTAGGLVNTGTLGINSGTAAATVTAGTLANTGAIVIVGRTAQAAVDIGTPAPSTWTGAAELEGNALLQFGGTSQIGTIGTNGEINLAGSQAFIASAGINSTSNSALVGLTTIASGGSLSLSGGASLTTNGGLTISAASGSGANGALEVAPSLTGGSTLGIAGTLTNNGVVEIGSGGNFVGTATATVTASALANTGEIVISGSATSQGSLEIGAAAPSTWTGTALLTGNALLQFAGTSQINTIGINAEISLTGPQAVVAAAGLGTTTNSALTNLSSNAGTFMIQSGGAPAVTLTTTTGLTNSGFTGVDSDSPGLGGSTFNIGGSLINSGTFVIGAGTFFNNVASSNVTTTALANTGNLQIQAGSTAPDTLTVNGPASNSGTGDVSIGLFSNLTVTGAGNTYSQSGGETTVSGKLTAPSVNVTGGTLILTSNSVLGQTATVVGNVNATGGMVLGNGNINGNLNINGGGAIEANNLTSSPTAPGTLTVNGNYVQSGGTFDAALLGTGVQPNEVNVTNGHSVNLTGGDLEAFGVTFALGQVFEDIMTFQPGELTGTFATLQGGGDGTSVNLGDGLTLEAIYDNAGGDISLEVVSTVPVPAPLIGGGVPAFLAVSGMLFGAKIRERSRKRRSLGAIPNA